MKIKKYNLGEKRWHIDAYPDNWKELADFKNWIKEHMPSCFCVYREDIFNNRHFEIRGTDQAQMMMIIFCWAN